MLKRIGYKAGNEAAESALAMGHSIVFMDKNSRIVELSPSGKKTTLKPHTRRKSYYVTYAKNTVLRATKK
jgi:hypothetical protein